MDRKTQYIYDRRREEAKRYSEEKIKEIYQNYPVLEEIDRLISKYHIRKEDIFPAVVSKNSPSKKFMKTLI